MELEGDFDPWDHGEDSSDDPGSNFYSNPEAFFRSVGAGGRLPIPDIWSPEAYETLHEILKRHETTIQKRWSKKTRQQRLKILLSAWPNMPVIHRPDFDAFRKGLHLEKSSKYRDCFMWPYINQDDLLVPKALPLLLNARGRHAPSHFAAADIDAMRLGIITQVIVPIFLNEHVMLMNGWTENTRDYGKLVSWEDNPDAFDWMTTGKQFQPGEGLTIHESQERVLAFLVQCCQEILHDIPEATMTSDLFPAIPEPQFKRESDISGFESLAVMAAEAPYRVLAQLDLRRVESLLAARASAAEDHLWALREDPDYFLRHVLEAKEHRQEMLKDVYGESHPVLSSGRQGLFWARVLGHVVVGAYLELELYSELSCQANKLATLQSKYSADICPSKDLPDEYRDALVKFHFYLDQAVKGPLLDLKNTAVASPPLRGLFVREPPPDAQSTKISTISKPGLKMSKVEEQLIWLLSTLWDNGQQLFLASLTVIVDEVERLLQSESEARELLSPYITKVVGDVSIIAQCLRQLDLYNPWAQTWEKELAERGDELKKEYAQRTEPWSRMYAALRNENLLRVASLGEPSGGKFTYPFEKRRTKENVEALRRAESNLDAFWTAIDRIMVAKAGDLNGTAVRRLLSQPRILQRTREWVEPEKTPPASSVREQLDTVWEPNLYTSYQPLSRIYSTSSATTIDIPQRKAKVKTRGTAQPSATETEVSLPSPTRTDTQPTFSVDVRALKVFRTLFFNPAVTSTPGEIPWNDFLHAMASVGFTIMKLYGSVWQFEPSNLDVERNIQFHEPHPRGKIPFTTARRFGRRLSRTYGWFGGMFILGGK